MFAAVSQLPASLSIGPAVRRNRCAVAIRHLFRVAPGNRARTLYLGRSGGSGGGCAEAGTRSAARRDESGSQVKREGRAEPGGERSAGMRSAATVRAMSIRDAARASGVPAPPARNPVDIWAKEQEGGACEVRCHDSVERVRLSAGPCERSTRRTRVRPQKPDTSV